MFASVGQSSSSDGPSWTCEMNGVSSPNVLPHSLPMSSVHRQVATASGGCSISSGCWDDAGPVEVRRRLCELAPPPSDRSSPPSPSEPDEDDEDEDATGEAGGEEDEDEDG